MEELSYSKAKVYSITYFIIKKYKMKSIISLYREHLLKKLTKEQFILVLLLCETYKKNDKIKSSVLYKFIDYYIRNNSAAFFNKLIFDWFKYYNALNSIIIWVDVIIVHLRIVIVGTILKEITIIYFLK